ncbi:uncharacterized [Tachysurus ichikawai]
METCQYPQARAEDEASISNKLPSDSCTSVSSSFSSFYDSNSGWDVNARNMKSIPKTKVEGKRGTTVK